MPRYTQDQELLAQSAARVLEAEAPIARFRASRDRGEAHDPALWARCAVAVAVGVYAVQLSTAAAFQAVAARCGRKIQTDPGAQPEYSGAPGSNAWELGGKKAF